MSASFIETFGLSGEIVLASFLKIPLRFCNSYCKNDYSKGKVNVCVFLLIEINQIRPRQMKKKCS